MKTEGLRMKMSTSPAPKNISLALSQKSNSSSTENPRQALVGTYPQDSKPTGHRDPCLVMATAEHQS